MDYQIVDPDYQIVDPEYQIVDPECQIVDLAYHFSEPQQLVLIYYSNEQRREK